MDKRYYITKDNPAKVRWIKCFINKDISWDDGHTHLVVTMKNSLNEAHRPNDVQVESVDVNDCFLTQSDAEQEIIHRERFGTK